MPLGQNLNVRSKQFVVVGSNSWLASSRILKALTLTVNGSATVESNAARSTRIFNPRPNFGAGSATCRASSGGSYGGTGGSSVCGSAGGFNYGSINQPSNLGSPGGGGSPGAHGGGAIKLTVAGTLSLAGQISADGATGAPAAKWRGQWIPAGPPESNVGTLTGNGTISANGGAANNPYGGGGGGGLVAIYFATNLFTGNVTAYGNTGTNAGGAGAFYLKNSTNTFAQVIDDNGGLSGATPLPLLVSFDLTISGSTVAMLTLSGSQLHVRNFFRGTNSWITCQSSSGPESTVISATNLTIICGWWYFI